MPTEAFILDEIMFYKSQLFQAVIVPKKGFILDEIMIYKTQTLQVTIAAGLASTVQTTITAASSLSSSSVTAFISWRATTGASLKMKIVKDLV